MRKWARNKDTDTDNTYTLTYNFLILNNIVVFLYLIKKKRKSYLVGFISRGRKNNTKLRSL